MEKNKATTYTPAKNNTGCRAPIGDTVFLFIGFWLFFSKDINLSMGVPGKLYLFNLNYLLILRHARAEILNKTMGKRR